MVNIEDIEPRQRATIHVKVTAGDIATFATLTGDYNPVHERIAHGMLVASYVSRLVGMELPGNGAFWTQQTFEWLKPVHAGDELDITLTIIHVSRWTSSAMVRVEAVNQDNVIVMTGNGVVLVPRIG